MPRQLKDLRTGFKSDDEKAPGAKVATHVRYGHLSNVNITHVKSITNGPHIRCSLFQPKSTNHATSSMSSLILRAAFAQRGDDASVDVGEALRRNPGERLKRRSSSLELSPYASTAFFF